MLSFSNYEDNYFIDWLILVQEGREPQYSKSPSEIDSLESSPGIISDQTHIVPFLGAYKTDQKKQPNNNNSYYQEHKQNLAIGMETDV
jgi:hypothetical protein